MASAPRPTIALTSDMRQALLDGKYQQAIAALSAADCPIATKTMWAAAIGEALPNHTAYSSRAATAAGRIAAVLAADPTCPSPIIDALSQARRAQVRQPALASPFLSDRRWAQVLAAEPTSKFDMRGIVANPRMANPGALARWIRTYPATHLVVLTVGYCPLELIQKALVSDDIHALQALVDGAACHGDVAEALATHQFAEIRCRLATRSDLTDDMMQQLAEDPAWEVRRNLAHNRRCPRSVYLGLIHDPSPWVRYGIVYNHTDLPIEMLRYLVTDSDLSVIRLLALQRHCDVEMLRVLDRQLCDEPTSRLCIARHRRCPPDLLIQYVSDPDPQIRRAAMRNRNCPAHIKAIAVLAG